MTLKERTPAALLLRSSLSVCQVPLALGESVTLRDSENYSASRD